MDQDTRNKLQRATQQVRRILEEEFAEQLEGTFDVLADGMIAADAGAHLDATQRLIRQKLLQAIAHIESGGKSTKDAIQEYLRQAAFTILNRFVALRMLEARDLLQECVSKGDDSSGFREFCGLAPGLSALPDDGYRLYLECLCDELTVEIKVLFDRRDPTTLLWPRRSTLTAMLDVLAQPELANAWTEDETIGWVYQYFNGDEERTKMRAESQAPRNSRELAVRNQFFTPRYVVQFLTDNTLGRTWYEMMQGDTQLAQLDYLVRRPDEVFLAPSTCEGHENCEVECATIARQLQSGNAESFPGFSAETDNQIQRMIQLAHCVSAYDQLGERAMEWFETIRTLNERDTESLLTRKTGEILNYLFMTCRADRHGGDGTVYAEPWFAAAANEVRRRSLQQDVESQEQLLKRPVYIPHRAKKDPRDLCILDPACGSGHFLLYTFDLLITIYEEAWADVGAAVFTETSTQLRADYESLEDLRRASPGLILRHNLHGVDIDPRAAQIAALALWMRAQRAYNQFEVDRAQRPPITKTNIVVAEPMPHDAELVDEFAANLKPAVLGDLFKKMVEEMKLAGELGSLLKIEESIAKAVEKAEEAHHKDGLFAEKLESQDFWDKADEEIIAALGSFAESAAGAFSVRRQLFAGDAAQGVAFIEMMRRRFDVVLMNPPFGEPAKRSKRLLIRKFGDVSNDIYAAFMSMALALCTTRGIVGCITSRAYLALPSFASLRQLLLTKSSVRAVVECGLGILDGATVRAAFSIYQKSQTHQATMFWDMRAKADVATSLLYGLQRPAETAYLVSPSILRSYPLTPFAYWLPTSLGKHLASGPYLDCTRVETTSRQTQLSTVMKGATTTDDFRFVRCHWEVPATEIANTWVRFAHSMGFCRYYAPAYALLKWRDDGRELLSLRDRSGNVKARLRCGEYFFEKGLVGPYISERGLGMCVLETGHAISNSARPVFRLKGHERELLGYLNSALADVFMWALTPDRKHEAGMVAAIPVPPGILKDDHRLGGLVDETLDVVSSLHTHHETNPDFSFSLDAFEQTQSLNERYIELQNQVDEQVSRLCGLAHSNVAELAIRAGAPHDYGDWRPEWVVDAAKSEENEYCAAAAHFVVSMAFGTAFSRYPALGTENSNACRTSPLEVERILCSDEGHPDDAYAVIRSVIRGFQSLAVDGLLSSTSRALDEAAELVCSLIRQSFFPGHVRDFTAAKRSAPIYWQLATHSASYSVWCYYHRLTRDTFFRVANDYVTPKVDHEERKLNTLRQEAGPDPASKQRKEIDAQETFVAELRAFLTEVKRIAPLWNPNLNDGVIINFAPLWRLVPQHKAWQKECKKVWDKLVKGDYDWAHLAMHLWPERVVPKCQDDRSLAIAHGLEDDFWYEDDDEKWQKRKPPEGGWEPVVTQLVDERSSPGVKAALTSLLEAPTPGGSTTGTKRRRKARAS